MARAGTALERAADIHPGKVVTIHEAPSLGLVTADPGEVKDWAEALPEKFLICRDINHRWSGYRAYREGKGRNAGFTRVLRCTACRTEREDTLDSRGYKVGTKYHYPDGYLTPKGTGRMGSDSRAALRLVSVLHAVDKTPDRPEEDA